MTASYTRALGRLIEHLSSGAANDVIGEALAAAVRLVRPRHGEIRLDDETLLVDGTPIGAQDTPEITTLREVMQRHRVSAVELRQGATPREVLQCCALLSAAPSTGDDPSIFAAAQRLNFWHLALHGQDAALAASPEAAAPEAFALSTRDEAEQQTSALVSSLDSAVERGHAVEVAHVLTRAVRTERAALADESLAAHWTDCVEHLLTPPSLRLTAALILDGGYPRAALCEVLARAGNEGTAVMMQYLTAAQSLLHRRLLFDAIVEIGVGIPVLVGHLEHKSWFVVRNAACLLGALRAVEAESALIASLAHPDERVRTSIATALVQLGTTNGRRALEVAIRDSSSEVRRRAMRGLLHGEGLARSAAVLSEAVDLERDPDVQLEVVATLRDLGTPHAVQQLARMCSPAALASKSLAYRRDAMEALVTLRPSAAAPFLRIQAQDRDPAVRALARALMERAAHAA